MEKSKEERLKIKKEISYEPLQEHELHGVADLIKSMRSYENAELSIRSTSQAYYHWMYYRNPAGKAVVWSARHNNKLIGTFAMAPKRFVIDSKPVVCGKTMDMFTHPEYQGLGLMNELTGRVFDEARRCGINQWYVTPSVMSYPIFLKKWGYREPFEVTFLSGLLRVSPLCERFTHFKTAALMAGRIGDGLMRGAQRILGAVKGYEMQETAAFGAETDELWERSRGYGVALVRDAVYLNWRYVDNPDTYTLLQCSRKGILRGIIITKYTNRQGVKVGEIVDFLCAPHDTDVLRAMIGHVLDMFYRDGCTLAQSWVIKKTRLARIMRRAGLYYSRKKVFFVLSPDAPAERFYDGNAWLLTQGDSNDI